MTAEINDESVANKPPFSGRKAQMFPQLTSTQITRLQAHGTHRHMSKGEILAQAAVGEGSGCVQQVHQALHD